MLRTDSDTYYSAAKLYLYFNLIQINNGDG
jgi:hypothetical protein